MKKHIRGVTGVFDSNNTLIMEGDVIRVLHRGESVPEREFRYVVMWSDEKGAYLVYNKHSSDYLGEIKEDTNFISCIVIGVFLDTPDLMDIQQGYPPALINKCVKDLSSVDQFKS